jgi:hypothetical protein
MTCIFLLAVNILGYQVYDLPNCFIEEIRFCNHCRHALLMLIFVDGHPVWKHNPLHGIALLKV